MVYEFFPNKRKCKICGQMKNAFVDGVGCADHCYMIFKESFHNGLANYAEKYGDAHVIEILRKWKKAIGDELPI
jgi:hypothetical protein